ncbi:MAG: hypothetical protein MRY63_12315 [Neomegalonema sp.]|nr:hypothetical protein [Neomegalonema sp.]
MTFTTALGLAREFAVLLLLLSLAALAVASMVGVGILSGPLAAALAVIAAAALVSMAGYGVLTGLLGLAPLWTVLFGLTLLLGLGAYATASFGVRGLWMSALGAAGMGLAALFLAVFNGTALLPFGVAMPALAFTVLAAMLAGSLGVMAHGVARRVAIDGEMAEPREVAALQSWRRAGTYLTVPPGWFDCRYAALGLPAVNPGLCASNPPQIASAPDWSTSASPETDTDQTLAALQGEAAEPAANAGSGANGPSSPAPDQIEPPQHLPQAPQAAPSPAAPAIETPDFATVLADNTVEQRDPSPLSASALETADAVLPDATPAPLPQVGAPQPDESIAALGLPSEEAAPQALSPDAASPLVGGDGVPPEPQGEDGPQLAALITEAAEASRTEFVCFPMLGPAADALCADQALTVADFDVSWLGAGADDQRASGVLERLSCYYDPALAVHLSVLVNLSADLAGTIPRSESPAAGNVRRADAIYEMVTRLISGFRNAASRTISTDLPTGDVPGGAQMPKASMSMYFAGGSSLRSPWASKEYGAGQIDRLFDLASDTHAFAMLKRMREEMRSVKLSTQAPPMVRSLSRLLEGRPSTQPGSEPAGRHQQVALLLTDRSAVDLPTGTAEQLAPQYEAAGVMLYAVTLGETAPDPELASLSHATGGQVFAVKDLESFAKVMDGMSRWTQSFCALRVTAPSFAFDLGGLSVTLERAQKDGCRLRQVATLSCEGVSMKRRLSSEIIGPELPR